MPDCTIFYSDLGFQVAKLFWCDLENLSASGFGLRLGRSTVQYGGRRVIFNVMEGRVWWVTSTK
jgi:hypothetical protein